MTASIPIYTSIGSLYRTCDRVLNVSEVGNVSETGNKFGVSSVCVIELATAHQHPSSADALYRTILLVFVTVMDSV
jgi:hypothetical protein